MKRVLIISGGKIEDDFASAYIREQKFDLVIAADSGIAFLHRHRIKPDILVGDFDSADEKTVAFYRQDQEIEFREFQPEKDDTDTEIAVLLAIEKGAEEVHLLGATGSRIDHMMANVYLLGLLLEKRIPAFLVDRGNRVRLINEKTVLRKDTQYGDYVSLLPFMGEVTGLTLRGFKYPLLDYTLGGCHSIGISNEILEDEAVISMESGRLIVMESKDDFNTENEKISQ